MKYTIPTGATEVEITDPKFYFPAPVNLPPTVNAGTDVEITLPLNSAQLVANVKDDGVISSILWKQVSGPTQIQLDKPTTYSVNVSGLSEGVYEFSCEVTDDNNQTAVDSVKVTVKPAVVVPPPSETTIQGFGADVTGGEGYPVKYVNSLTASALRTAIGTGNCIVKFNVSGTITGVRLNYTNLKNVTIDGEGKITLNNGNNGDLFSFEGSGCSNIIIKGLKLRNAGNDLIGIRCSNVVIMHNSFDGAGDGLCDITVGASKVSVCYNIFGASNAGSILLAYTPTKEVSIFGNIFTDRDRAPMAHNASGSWPNSKSNPVSYLMADVVNNAFTNYNDRATIASYGGTLWVRDNWYYNDNGIRINADEMPNDNSSKIVSSGNITASGKTIGITNTSEWAIAEKYKVKSVPAKDLLKFLKAVVGTGNNDTKDNSLIAMFP